MSRILLRILLACGLVLSLGVGSLVLAKPKSGKQREMTEKVKAGILSLGVGPEARIEVKLRNKTKLSGFISEADEDSFAITDNKTGAKTIVPYGDIASAKGNNWQTKKTIIVTAVILGALAIIYFAAFHGKHL